MSIKQLAQSMCRGPDGRPRCAGSQIKPVTRGEGEVWACELKPFSQRGIEGGFGQCWSLLTVSEIGKGAGGGGRASEEGKRGRVLPAKVVTMVMEQDHAWGEATGQPTLKEARFPWHLS